MMRQRSFRQRATGAALISALLIAALVTLLGSSLLLSQETWIAQLGHQNDRLQARELAHIGMHWARAILYDDLRRGTSDHLGEAWAQSLKPIDVDGVTIEGRIIDAQSRFNLNSLVKGAERDPDGLAAYTRLLGLLGLPAELAQSLADWEDADDETGTPGGAENYYYLALPQPYRCANAPLSDIDELRWVRGYTPAVIARLAPYVIALPATPPVNANTALPEVLAASAGITLMQAQQLVATRMTYPALSAEALANRLPVANGSARLGVSSSFFLIQGQASKAATRFRIEALVSRQADRWPSVVWIRQR